MTKLIGIWNRDIQGKEVKRQINFHEKDLKRTSQEFTYIFQQNLKYVRQYIIELLAHSWGLQDEEEENSNSDDDHVLKQLKQYESLNK